MGKITTNSPYFPTWGAPFVAKMKGLLRALLVAFVSSPPMKDDLLKFLRRCDVPDKDIQVVGRALFKAEMKLDKARRLGSALLMVVLKIVYDVKCSLSKDFVRAIFAMNDVPFSEDYDLVTPIELGDLTEESLGFESPDKFVIVKIESDFLLSPEPASASVAVVAPTEAVEMKRCDEVEMKRCEAAELRDIKRSREDDSESDKSDKRAKSGGTD